MERLHFNLLPQCMLGMFLFLFILLKDFSIRLLYPPQAHIFIQTMVLQCLVKLGNTESYCSVLLLEMKTGHFAPSCVTGNGSDNKNEYVQYLNVASIK